MMNEYFAYLTKEFQERMTMLSEAMARGQCASIEDYKFAVGQFRGLEAACAIVKDLNDKLENTDE
jgi:hypothetical protein